MQISCHKDLIFKKCVFPKNCTFKQTVYVLYSWTCNKPLSTRNCGVTTWNRLTTLYRFLRIGFFLYKLYRDMYHFVMQLVKKNVTQSTVASWGPWASSVAGTWGTLEDIVHKLIYLSAPHCNFKVLGAIWDAWPPTDPYNIQLMRSYFCKIWFVTHSSQ